MKRKTPMARTGFKAKRHANIPSGGRKRLPAKPKRKNLPSRAKLVRTLDTLTSQIVRLRDGRCVQCGTTEKLTCGHVLSRRSHATRWSLLNCHAQCWPHNFAHGSHSPVPYFQWFIKQFGQPIFDDMYREWAKGRKFSTPELREMVTEYETMLKELS